MQQPNFTSPNRIQVHDGFLKVPGSRGLGTDDLIIRERTAHEYLEFYRLWREAMSLIEPTDTFASAWLQKPLFSELLTQATQHLGIENLTSLKLSQIQELLLSCPVADGSQELPHGLLFRLHQDFPKVPTLETQGTRHQVHGTQNSAPPKHMGDQKRCTCAQSCSAPWKSWLRSLTANFLVLLS